MPLDLSQQRLYHGNGYITATVTVDANIITATAKCIPHLRHIALSEGQGGDWARVGLQRS